MGQRFRIATARSRCEIHSTALSLATLCLADGGYAGDKLKRRLRKLGCWTIEVVNRTDDMSDFAVLPRRWGVERTFAWLGRSRRLAKDFEKSIASAEAWITVAHIRLLTRRLTRYCYAS